MHRDLKFNILSEGIKNGISVTCRKYNISRTIYYRWLKRYKSEGIDGLKDIKKDFVPVNRTNSEIESTLLKLIRTYPSYGPRAVKYLLDEIGFDISESAVFNVMKRHQLTNKENRLRFARRKEKLAPQTIPPLNELKSGECWIFWITDYGHFEGLGPIYEYTFYDFKSRIACTRYYPNISYHNFEDLLMAVAIPVAQTLNLEMNYLCFFEDSNIISYINNQAKSKINRTIQDNGLDVELHILKSYCDLSILNTSRKAYTQACISFMMPLLQKRISFDQLKIHFQHYVRDYNISNKQSYAQGTFTPVEYHNQLLNTKMILPIWAYMDRIY